MAERRSAEATGLNVTDPIEFFAADYFQARDRFCESAASCGAQLFRYTIDVDSNLSIDVAIIDRGESRKRLILSSGVHGVEGPLGSAIQLATLDMIRRESLPGDIGYVFLHAINPYGFAHHRRWNEDNVDLNRNFQCPSNTYEGCPNGYTTFEATLNPPTAPSRWEPFRMKAFWNIARHGVQAIKEAVATGQYEYPKGLFFGGHQECCSPRIIREYFDQWVGDADDLLHLDVHTGLGRFGDYRLLLEYPPDSPVVRWFRKLFGDALIEDAGDHQTSYDARGTFGLWSTDHFRDRQHRFATIEVGTHSIVRVLGALRAENRAHHYAPDTKLLEWAKRELRECFCPASAKWRRKVVREQMHVLQRCADALQQGASKTKAELNAAKRPCMASRMGIPGP